MSSKIAYRIMYNRANKLDKKGRAPVVIEAYQNPVRRYFSTGIKLKPGEWDTKKNQVKSNPSYNAAISKQKSALEDFELRFPATYGREFTLADFDLLNDQPEAVKAKKRLSLSAFMLEQIERDKVKLSYSAYIRYKRTVGNLVDFNEGQPVEFVTLDYTFVDGFDHYLRTVRKHHQNTIYKEHQVINQYFKRAALMDLVKASKNPYLHFKSKKQATVKDVLYPAEIQRIEQLTFSDDQQHLAFYRDAFLFSLYSLLRIGDVTDIRQRHLTATDKGLLYEKVSQKTRNTNSTHRLPLYDLHRTSDGPSKPERILQQYARTDNAPLFRRSHPKLNEQIKVVMALAGIRKNVTFHTARHSGITWLVILGLELPHIQRLAQHANITTTMQYVHLAEHITGERLSKIDWTNESQMKKI